MILIQSQSQFDVGQVSREKAPNRRQSRDLLDLSAGDPPHYSTVQKRFLTQGLLCQGLPQYIQLDFPSPVIPKRVKLTFQGGFVGTRCAIDIPCTSKEAEAGKMTWRTLTRIYPEDINRQQNFNLEAAGSDVVEESVQSLKLVFEESSDFFGRITVYDLQVDGQRRA